MRSERLRHSLAAALCGLCAFVLAHAVLEWLSRFAENELGAYVWHGEEHQVLFLPTSWEERGSGRLQLCGPSEAREAFRLDVLGRELAPLEPFSNAQSWGTLTDLLVMLEYAERSYGKDALPEHLIVGINVRWVASLGLELSPTLRAIDSYGPRLRIDASSDRVELVAKGALDGTLARVRHRLHQGRRYGNALRAVARHALTGVNPRIADALISRERTEPYRFANKAPRSLAFVRRFAERPQPLWIDVQRWDAREHEVRLQRDFASLRALCERNGTALYVVNLPVRPAVADFYDEELYAAYLSVVRRTLDGVPFLDLTDLLHDEEFFDSVHATRKGAESVSLAVAEFVAGELERRGTLGERMERAEQPEVGQ